MGHPKVGRQCPWSGETKNKNFGYAVNGSERDLAKAREIYGMGLDWDSYGLPMWLTRAEGLQQWIEGLMSPDV
jgi:hypothetical protein